VDLAFLYLLVKVQKKIKMKERRKFTL